MSLEQKLTNELYNLYETIKTKAGYDAKRFRKMLDEHGGLNTVKLLLNSKHYSDGYIELFKRDRLDLSVEATILQEKWKPLFTDTELDTARKRLRKMEYKQD